MDELVTDCDMGFTVELIENDVSKESVNWTVPAGQWKRSVEERL